MNNILLIELEGGQHGVELKEDNLIVVFDSIDKANHYRLGLIFETHKSPLKAPKDFHFTQEKGGISYFIQLNQKKIETSDEWEESCCESGCPGCPWTIAQESNL